MGTVIIKGAAGVPRSGQSSPARTKARPKQDNTGLKSCPETGGILCYASEECTAALIESSDNQQCCSSQCEKILE